MKTKTMKLHPLTTGLALGILGAFLILLITYYPAITKALPFMNEHGNSMRFVFEDLYPIFTHTAWYKVLLGIVYGFIDGFVFGILMAYLYNWLLPAKW